MYSKIRYTFYDPINKKLGFFKFCPPIWCVWRTVVGHFDACSVLSWLMWQKFSTTVGYHDQSSRLPWCMWWKSLAKTNVSDFFSLEQTTVLIINNAYHDKAPLYWTAVICHHGNSSHALLSTTVPHTFYGSSWVKSLFTANPSKSANTASEINQILTWWCCFDNCLSLTISYY